MQIALSALVAFLTSDTGLALLGTGASMVFTAFVYKRWKHSAAFKEAVAVASEAASKVAPLTPTKLDDKVAVFLKHFREHLEGKKVPVTPKTEDKAKAAFLAAVEGK